MKSECLVLETLFSSQGQENSVVWFFLSKFDPQGFSIFILDFSSTEEISLSSAVVSTVASQTEGCGFNLGPGGAGGGLSVCGLHIVSGVSGSVLQSSRACEASRELWCGHFTSATMCSDQTREGLEVTGGLNICE